jgi:hypothetical protein
MTEILLKVTLNTTITPLLPIASVKVSRLLPKDGDVTGQFFVHVLAFLPSNFLAVAYILVYKPKKIKGKECIHVTTSI